jgi:hypothetical protein
MTDREYPIMNLWNSCTLWFQDKCNDYEHCGKYEKCEDAIEEKKRREKV